MVHRLLLCLLGQLSCLRAVCCCHLRASQNCIVLISVLVKEVRTWGKMWERYLRFAFCVIKRMRKKGEFKISLSHPRHKKIFRNLSGRELMGEGERGKECFKCGL